jgi:tetratricopeptide (TPR) repeat protein
MDENELKRKDQPAIEAWSTRSSPNSKAVPARTGPPPLVWLMMGVLGLIALAVIFVLPGIVEDYELPFTPRAEVVEVNLPNSGNTPATTAISPFEEAQRAKQRQEAQAVLASLLERQAALEELEVAIWAEAEYAAALEFATLGDESYRSRAFLEATTQYENADSALEQIQALVPQVLATSLAQGQQALVDGDAELAKDQFTLAALIEPEDAAALAGLRRADSLDEVNRLVDEAEDLRDASQLDEALATAQRAVALDGAQEQARALVSSIRVQIADNAFTRVMSQGFTALQAGESEAAIVAFERALAMRPNSTQAQEAITQTKDQLAVTQINVHRGAAEDFAAQEQWAAAVREFDAALGIDSNLVFAIEGKDYAGKRAQLDTLLQSAIDQPARLADTAVYEQVVQVYYTGRNLNVDGARLEGQLNELEGLLNRAQVPVEVQLVSDNQTVVTLYQVGELGKFSQQVLSLKPGKYVAVGTRPGYRDVREEFEVGFGNSSAPVTVACTDEIVARNRR